MIFEEIFLERSDLRKYAIFREIAHHTDLTPSVNDLAIALNLSYSRAYSAYQEVLEDLSRMTNMTSVEIKRQLSSGQLPADLDSYRFFLLNDSIAFLLVDYIAQGHSPNAGVFFEQHFTSRSTVRRKTNALREFLQKYNLDLSLTRAEITGPEIQIRLFFYTFYWLAYHGTRWPFKAIDYDQTLAKYMSATQQHTPTVGSSQDCIFWGVCRLRIIRGHILDMPQTFEKMLPLFNFRTAIYTRENSPKLTKDQLRAENALFYFFRTKQIHYPSDSEADEELIEALLNEPKLTNPVSDFAIGVLTRLNPQLQPADDSQLRRTATAHVLRYSLASYLFEGPYPQLNDYFPKKDTNSAAARIRSGLKAYIDSLPSTAEFEGFRRARERLAEKITLLFSPLIVTLSQLTPLNVSLLTNYRRTSNEELRDFLNSHPNVVLSENVDDLSQCELIVTQADNLSVAQQLAQDDNGRLALRFKDRLIPLFDWKAENSLSEYHRLTEAIEEIYEEKLTQQPSF